MGIEEMQRAFYDASVDYTPGSPHLSHPRLKRRLVGLLETAAADLRTVGLPLRVLEIGAGHGGYTEPALAIGCEVTAVEMSRPALDVLLARFSTNPQLTGVYDEDGSLADVDGGYSLVLIVSVLHHIPDYLTFLEDAVRHLAPGGSILSLQDPLWYGRVPKLQRIADRGAYLAWRLSQGQLRRGLRTRLRRLHGRLDETNPSDMVEYHVVRDGVDERAVADRLRPAFRTVSTAPYWSSQPRAGQRLGERLGWANTFAVYATGYQPASV